jgi:hypothetical protein
MNFENPKPLPVDRFHRRNADFAGFAAVLIVAAAIHGWIAAYDYSVTTFTDSMDYLFMADYYRYVFYGDIVDHAVHYYRVTRFPPLFPLILGAFGAGSENTQLATVVSSGIAVLAALSVFGWVRIEFDSPWTAALIALATVLFPYYFLISLSPVSEPLGLLLTATAFALLAGAGKPPGTRLLAAALIVGIAPIARTALIPACLAFVIWLWILRPAPRLRLLLLSGLSLLPIAAWTAYRGTMPADNYASYLTAAQFAEAGMSWPASLWRQPAQLLASFRAAWGDVPNPLMPFSAAAIAFLAMTGTLIRIRQNRLDAWFLSGYVALILIWPFPHELSRFVAAVFPFLLVSALTAARFFCDRLRLHRAFAGFLLVSLTVSAGLPTVLRYAHRASLPVAQELLGEKREPVFFDTPTDDAALLSIETYARGRLLLVQSAGHIPEGECMYALPYQLGMLYSERLVLPYPRNLDADSPQTRSRLAACDYFYIGAFSAAQGGIPPYYPLGALGPWTEPILISKVSFKGKEGVAAILLRRKQLEGD